MEPDIVAVEDVAVEDVAVEDVAENNVVVENVAVENVEHTVDSSALKDTLEPSDIVENIVTNISDCKQVDDNIRPFSDVPNLENKPYKDDEIDIDKVAKVMEISTEAPRNSGDGGSLSAEMPKHSEDYTNPGHSNVCIKKRRNVHILIFDKREILPRKSKTKAYEYLKNIARGFSAAANAGDRRRVQRKRLIRNLRGNKSSPSRKRTGGRRSAARKPRIGVRHSGTSLSSGMTDITGSSNVSSRYNDRFA